METIITKYIDKLTFFCKFILNKRYIHFDFYINIFYKIINQFHLID